MGFLRWNSVLFKFTMSMRFLWDTAIQILLRMYHVPLARGQQTEQQIKTVLCYGGGGIFNEITLGEPYLRRIISSLVCLV